MTESEAERGPIRRQTGGAGSICPWTARPDSVGSLRSSHSAHPAFSSFTKNPRSANCRAALAERCQVSFQQ
jgi:hypothetical protein